MGRVEKCVVGVGILKSVFVETPYMVKEAHPPLGAVFFPKRPSER